MYTIEAQDFFLIQPSERSLRINAQAVFLLQNNEKICLNSIYFTRILDFYYKFITYFMKNHSQNLQIKNISRPSSTQVLPEEERLRSSRKSGRPSKDQKRKKNCDGTSQSHWSKIEQSKYINFLFRNKEMFMKPVNERKSERIHTKLSKYMKIRSPGQCRSHHQKMLLTYHDIEGIIQHFEHMIYKTRLPKHQEDEQLDLQKSQPMVKEKVELVEELSLKVSERNGSEKNKLNQKEPRIKQFAEKQKYEQNIQYNLQQIKPQQMTYPFNYPGFYYTSYQNYPPEYYRIIERIQNESMKFNNQF